MFLKGSYIIYIIFKRRFLYSLKKKVSYIRCTLIFIDKNKWGCRARCDIYKLCFNLLIIFFWLPYEKEEKKNKIAKNK